MLKFVPQLKVQTALPEHLQSYSTSHFTHIYALVSLYNLSPISYTFLWVLEWYWALGPAPTCSFSQQSTASSSTTSFARQFSSSTCSLTSPAWTSQWIWFPAWSFSNPSLIQPFHYGTSTPSTQFQWGMWVYCLIFPYRKSFVIGYRYSCVIERLYHYLCIITPMSYRMLLCSWV